MCGFAGVVAWDERYRVRPETLRAMSAKVAHRGPDGAAEWFNQPHEHPITPASPQCGLAFRRLAILDPDPRSMQPFTIGTKTMVFNGEIYNYRELRQELKSLRSDYDWRTTGDTEVLLLAYDTWGERCLERLNGMFAIGVWDDREKTLFLARDRMGQKPLYFARTDGTFAFASEVGALLRLSWFSVELDGWGFDHYLSYGYTLGCTTIYEGAAKVEPGHFLHALPDRPPKTARYFDCNAGWLEPGRRPDCEARDRTRKHLREAVTRQLVADVPLGCFLSGGIDSSIIASLMRARGKTACTFSVRFEDPRHDESAHAAAVARHLGTEHECFTVRADAAADLPRLATVFGEPFADSSALPTHYLAREVRKRVKVALSGDGGDELFGGYDRYRAMALAERVRSVPGLRHALLPNVLRWLPGHHPKSLMTRAKRFASSVALAADERYEQYIRIFDQNAVDELLGVKTLEFPYEHQGTRSGRDPVEKALAWDRLCYLPDDLLTKVDRASMLHGLEVRSPFMDHELVQFAAGLTTDQLLKGGPKRMLREAFADVLPAWVFKRRKMGFAVPIGEWFRTDAPLRAMLHDCLFAADAFGRGHFEMNVVRRLVDEHMAERVDHSQRLYALLMLELWWRSTR